MGYILPINHEQYTQYANRTVKKDALPLTLTPVYKVTMDTKLKERAEQQEKFEDFNNDNNDIKNETKTNTHTHTNVDPNLIDYYVTTITGKGTLFNEVV